jgi:glutathione S-transferase
MYELYIANKNYSSWSLRAWVLLRQLQIPFKERLIAFGDAPAWDAYRKICPSGRVPGLIDGDLVVWDSLSIAEYVAEKHPGVWPGDRRARAWARSAAAEMHSGFAELRNRCSMSCGVRIRLNEVPAGLIADVARIDGLWSDGLNRFGGPYLAGSAFTAVDAFFAPVAFRVQGYALELGRAAAEYADRLLDIAAMREWYAAALEETTRDLPHESEILQMGSLLEDRRARPG